MKCVDGKLASFLAIPEALDAVNARIWMREWTVFIAVKSGSFRIAAVYAPSVGSVPDSFKALSLNGGLGAVLDLKLDRGS